MTSRRERLAIITEAVRARCGDGPARYLDQEAAWLLADIAQLEKALEAARLANVPTWRKVNEHNSAIDRALEGDHE